MAYRRMLPVLVEILVPEPAKISCSDCVWSAVASLAAATCSQPTATDLVIRSMGHI